MTARRKLGEFVQPPESRRKLVDHVANELLDAVGVGSLSTNSSLCFVGSTQLSVVVAL